MKVAFRIVMVSVLAAVFAAACASAPEAEPERAPIPEPTTRRPEMLDHRNFKWGTPVPDWVTMEIDELEQMGQFQDYYVFRFESPRAQSLQGAELWTQQFTAQSAIAQEVENRVQTRFAGAAAGGLDLVETYMEQVVASISDTTVSGYRRARDYWVRMRYYEPDGAVDEDAYTYVVMYTIPRETLDRMVRDALDRNDGSVESDEERTVRDRVKEAFERGL